MDPHRIFTSAEWEKLGTMRSIIRQMRDGGGRVGRGGNDNRSTTNSTPNCKISGVSVSNNNDNNTATNDASVVSEITER